MNNEQIKISLCIPQYNRIDYLLKSLEIIARQTYPNIEIVISDDCSTDDTTASIEKISPNYKYNIRYERNEVNLGYDRNYRKCIELATGEYALVIGNDDSIKGNDSIEQLVSFIKDNDFPEIGFCNMIEERTGNTFIERALHTQVIGSGADVAMKYYTCFSFVGGLIYKKTAFTKYNTDKYDGSIYSQMYLGSLMISSGCTLFSIREPLVIKDLLLEGKVSNSYRDNIAKSWKEFRKVDGGLPSVMNVLINALTDSGAFTQKRIKFIFTRMYSVTYPHWILDYKENSAFPEAVGLILGMNPIKVKNFKKLTIFNRISIFIIYLSSSFFALLTPVFVFKKIKGKLYRYFKK